MTRTPILALSALVALTACTEVPQVDRGAATSAVDCRNQYRQARLAAENAAAQSVAQGTSAEFSQSVGSMMGYLQVENREARRLADCYEAVGAPAWERRPVNDLSVEHHATRPAGNRPSTGGGAGFSNY